VSCLGWIFSSATTSILPFFAVLRTVLQTLSKRFCTLFSIDRLASWYLKLTLISRVRQEFPLFASKSIVDYHILYLLSFLKYLPRNFPRFFPCPDPMDRGRRYSKVLCIDIYLIPNSKPQTKTFADLHFLLKCNATVTSKNFTGECIFRI